MIKRYMGALMAFLLCVGMMPAAAFAAPSTLGAASINSQAAVSLQPVSSETNPVAAKIVNPEENDVEYKLYERWSDDTPEGMGAYHWSEITLADYVDAAGIHYFFITNPEPGKADTELFCTLIYVPKDAEGGTANVPGYVQLTDADGNNEGSVREVVKIGYSGGSAYTDATAEQNKLTYWYAKQTNDNSLKGKHGTNDDITADKDNHDGPGSAQFSAIFLPKTLKKIGDTCFYEHTTLSVVKFEDGTNHLEELGWRVFQGCSSLKTLDLPDSITNIGSRKYCRYGTHSGSSIDYSDSNIGKYATQNNGTELVKSFEDRVETLDSTGGVFTNCSSLESIHMPAKLSYLGSKCFSGCTSLDSFEFPKGLTTVFDVSSTDSRQVNVLDGATVKRVTFAQGSNITTVEDYAFQDFAFDEVILPEGFTSIGKSAFHSSKGADGTTSSTGVKKIVIPSTVETLGASAFGVNQGFSRLEEVVFTPGSKLKEIPEEEFAGSSLSKIEIPASVESIGKSAFNKSSKLKEISFEAGSRLVSIGNTAFTSTALVSFVAPDSLTSIGDSAFSNCLALQSIEFGKGLKSFGQSVLFNPKALKRIVINADGEIAFNGGSSNPSFVSKVVANVPDKVQIYFTGSNVSIKDSDSKPTFGSNEFYMAKELDVYGSSDSLKNFFENTSGGKYLSGGTLKDNPVYTNVTVKYQDLMTSNFADAADTTVAEGGTYDGTAKEPTVTVTPKDSSMTLTEGTDYEVSYSDNVNAGKGKATIKGLGAYFLSDPVELEFTIAPASIAGATIDAIGEQTATGKAFEPAVSASVKLGESEEATPLTAADYDVAYKNNTLPGTATVTLTGKGNYTGAVSTTFTIVAAEADKAVADEFATKLADLDVSAISAGDTKAAEEAVKAYNELTDVQKAVVPGAASMKVVAAQQAVAKAKQEAAEAAKAEAEAAATKSAAAQKAAEDAKAASAADAAKAAADAAAAKAAEQKAAAGAAEQKAAAEAATAEAAKLKAELAKASKIDLSGATVSVAAATYTGKALKPAVTVKLGSKTLKEGTDYSVTYLNNKAGGTNTATAVVVGKGSYAGAKTKAFSIAPAANSAKAAKASVAKKLKANKKTKKLAKAKTIALPKVKTKFGTAKWSVSTKDKKKVLSLSGSKVKVKKGAKKGTYTIKLKAKVAKTANYKAASTKVVTVKVTVK